MAWLTICHLVGGDPVIRPQQVGRRLFPLDPALLRRLDPALAQSSHELHYPVGHTVLSAVQKQHDCRLLCSRRRADIVLICIHQLLSSLSCAAAQQCCSARQHLIGGGRIAHFFSSHLEGMKRRLGSGAADRELISLSRVNQSISGSKGFTCARTTQDHSSVMGKECSSPVAPTRASATSMQHSLVPQAAVTDVPSCLSEASSSCHVNGAIVQRLTSTWGKRPSRMRCTICSSSLLSTMSSSLYSS